MLLVACAVPALAAPGQAADSSRVKALFKNPPREYSTGPLWVWNDMLTEEQIRDTLRDLAGQKVKQVFVHPRPGLMTPYLSADWFRLWKVALDEAERLDMNVWIYDENSYPSGFAGGWVPELMPESRGRGLAFRESQGRAEMVGRPGRRLSPRRRHAPRTSPRRSRPASRCRRRATSWPPWCARRTRPGTATGAT